MWHVHAYSETFDFRVKVGFGTCMHTLRPSIFELRQGVARLTRNLEPCTELCLFQVFFLLKYHCTDPKKSYIPSTESHNPIP